MESHKTATKYNHPSTKAVFSLIGSICKCCKQHLLTLSHQDQLTKVLEYHKCQTGIKSMELTSSQRKAHSVLKGQFTQVCVTPAYQWYPAVVLFTQVLGYLFLRLLASSHYNGGQWNFICGAHSNEKLPYKEWTETCNVVMETLFLKGDVAVEPQMKLHLPPMYWGWGRNHRGFCLFFVVWVNQPFNKQSLS